MIVTVPGSIFPADDRKPTDLTIQIMIDPERKIVEGPGGGTNEYCTRESDWMVPESGVPNVESKIIKQCTTLHVSELSYSFTGDSDSRTRGIPTKNTKTGDMVNLTG